MAEFDYGSWAMNDMVQGYLDGRNADVPEPSGNRSLSYHHGFRNGRDELENKRPRADAEKLRKMADEAIRADMGVDL